MSKRPHPESDDDSEPKRPRVDTEGIPDNFWQGTFEHVKLYDLMTIAEDVNENHIENITRNLAHYREELPFMHPAEYHRFRNFRDRIRPDVLAWNDLDDEIMHFANRAVARDLDFSNDQSQFLENWKHSNSREIEHMLELWDDTDFVPPLMFEKPADQNVSVLEP